MFKVKYEDDWKKNYILEFNQMRDAYEKKLQKKQIEIDTLKADIVKLKNSKNTLKPKEKQITDIDIQCIKDLRLCGLSYSEISKRTNWSKATVSRVLNGLYD
jgi:response regulator of citrate/malate metabolism